MKEHFGKQSPNTDRPIGVKSKVIDVSKFKNYKSGEVRNSKEMREKADV